jgi:hypothetical protein
VLSADGRHLAYACHTQSEGQPDQVLVVHDGQHFGPYADVFGVALSADGQHLAYASPMGHRSAHGRTSSTGSTIGSSSTSLSPRFSADGRHVAWVAQRNRGSAAANCSCSWMATATPRPTTIFALTFALGSNRLTRWRNAAAPQPHRSRPLNGGAAMTASSRCASHTDAGRPPLLPRTGRELAGSRSAG